MKSGEIKNILGFIANHGDSSVSVKTSLDEKESEVSFYRQQIQSLRSANADRLLLTPFVLKDQFQRITELLDTNKAQANLAIRNLIPDGLSCKSIANTDKKNLNQNNSKWIVTGTMLVHHSNEIGANSFVSPVSRELNVVT